MLLPVSLAVALAALAAWLLLRALLPNLRRRLLDQPNARSAHSQPTPRGGGVAFVLVAAAASAIGWFGVPFSGQPVLPGSQVAMVALPLLALPLAVVGFLDDRHNLPAGLRYGVQLATALLLILVSPLPLPWLGLPLLLIAVTAVINFTNFMDGLDGLVAGCMVFLFAVAALTGMPALWPLVGALLGFLLWNWSPAKVFMGDVGSTFLGAVFAGVVLQQVNFQAALGLLLVATPLLGDACVCVPRRLLGGQRVFQAHRLHLFQRLHQAGWSHGRVASLYAGATAVLSLTLLVGGLFWVSGLAVGVLLIGLWLDQRVAVSFALASGTSSHSPQV